MSAPAFAWALEQGATLKLLPADRLVLLYLADMANGEKVCWPGQETIVRYTGLAPNTVMKALRRLAAIQLIRVESRTGYVSRYHIMRDDTPAKCVVVTPAIRGDLPPQNVPTHPHTICGTPPHDLRLTPANCGDDPSKTLSKTPKTRVGAREEAKDSNGGEGSGAPPPPAPPPKAPALGATKGGGQDRPQRPPSDDPLDQPVDPKQLADLANRIARGFQNNYPPRAAILDHHQQREVIEAANRPKPRYLAPEYLAAIRRAAGYGVLVS